MKLWGIAVVAGFGLAGCGDRVLGPHEACDQVESTLCERAFACLSADERSAAGYPETEDACVTMRRQQFSCSDLTEATA